MPRIITVEEKPDSLRIWRNGQLIVNFHDSSFLVAQQMYGPDPLVSILVEYPGLLEDFIKQLRIDGKLPTGPAPQSNPPASIVEKPFDLFGDEAFQRNFHERTGVPFAQRWREVGEEMEALHSEPSPDANVPEAVSKALAVSPDNQTRYDRKLINDWHESILARIQGMEGQQQ